MNYYDPLLYPYGCVARESQCGSTKLTPKPSNPSLTRTRYGKATLARAEVHGAALSSDKGVHNLSVVQPV